MIRRCTIDDLEFVDSILKHDSIYPFISDDYCPKAEDYTCAPLLSHNGVYYLSPDKNSIFVYIPINSITYEVHSNVLPPARNRSSELALMTVKYMFEQTKCMKIKTHVPVFNTPALHLSFKCGLRVEGNLRESFLKNNKLYDQIILGLSKGEWSCQ